MTFTSGRSNASPPDLRILHYNDVYHVDPSSAEPVGGIARFMTVCREYRENDRYKGQPGLVTLFSGDVFSPSLESSITKGPSPSEPSNPLRSRVVGVALLMQTTTRKSHGPDPEQDWHRLCMYRRKLRRR